MAAWHEDARQLRAEGLNNAEIGRRLGVSKRTVWGLFNDPPARAHREKVARITASKAVAIVRSVPADRITRQIPTLNIVAHSSAACRASVSVPRLRCLEQQAI